MYICAYFIISVINLIYSFIQKLELKIDSTINLEIEKYKASNINEIGYTKLACINYGIRTTAYLFWNDGNNAYIQKFEDSEYDDKEVQKFRPVIIVDSVFFDFYKKNSTRLTSEEVKEFSYKPDSIDGTRIHSYIITRSHSCFRNFRLFVKDKYLNKCVNFFDLKEYNEEQIDNSKLSEEHIKAIELEGFKVDTTYENTPIRNINFEINNTMKIVEWDLLLSKFIEKIESENEFIEIKNQ